MKQTVIMLATLGVLALGTAPSGPASADIDSPVATVQASMPTASAGWAVSKWNLTAGLVVGGAIATRSGWLSWRIGSQIGGWLGGLGGAFIGGALGAF